MPVTPREFYRNQLVNSNLITLYTPPASSTVIYQEMHFNSKISGNSFIDVYISGEGKIQLLRQGILLTSGTPVEWFGNYISHSGALLVKCASGVDIMACGLEIT